MSKPKIKTVTTVINDKKAKIVEDNKGEKHIVVLEQANYYSFTNLRPGLCFFKRDNGLEDFFKGKETKTDISEREREILLNSKDFTEGWIVEEKEKADVSEEEVMNKNALSPSRLQALIKKHTKNQDFLKTFIGEMTSDFAVKRMKDILIQMEMPSSLVMICDVRIQELEEEYLSQKKAPEYKE